MSKFIEDSCLCGSIQYASDAEGKGTFVCHCTDCQKQTGTSFSVVVAVPIESFKVSGESISSFETTGEENEKPVYRYFCQNCCSS